MACYCYNANSLHDEIKTYTKLCLTYASVDQLDGYSTLFY